jgi:MYXO-CTERM domain-containing protein
LATFTADLDMVFDDVQTVPTNTALTWLTSFTSPPDQSVHFNNGMFTLKMSGAMGTNGRIVTLYDGATNRPTRYYAYGKTLDNQTDHWYDFTFDGVTGAEIKNDRIILHFVDGERGDDDLDPNNDSISHTGAQAVVTTSSTQSAQSGGCSIATTPSKTPRGGDWIIVSLFLGMLALVRRRARRQVQCERVTNIASP